MPKNYIPGRRYKFSRDLYLIDTANVMKYKNIKILRDLIDMLDGVEVINGCIGKGEMKFTILTEWTEEIVPESYLRRIFRDAVKKVQREDEMDKLIERYEETKDKIAEYEMLIEELKDEQGCILEEYRQLKSSDERAYQNMKI